MAMLTIVAILCGDR